MTVLWPNGGTAAPAKPGKATSGFRSTSEYGQRFHPVDHVWRLHAGIDLIWGAGAINKSPVNGVVTIAGYLGAYGILVEVTGPDGTRYRMGHNRTLSVKKGDKVKAGQNLGAQGMTGKASGVHTHYEVLPKGKSQVNPRPWMANANAGSSGGGSIPFVPEEDEMIYILEASKSDKDTSAGNVDTAKGKYFFDVKTGKAGRLLSKAEVASYRSMEARGYGAGFVTVGPTEFAAARK